MSFGIRKDQRLILTSPSNQNTFWNSDNFGNIYNTNNGDVSSTRDVLAVNMFSTNSVKVGISGELNIRTDNSSNSFISNSNAINFTTGSLNLLSYVGINTTTPTSQLDINGNTIRIRNQLVPGVGKIGEIGWDDSKIYVRTSTGWKYANLIV